MNRLGALLLASALAAQDNVSTTVVYDRPIGPANRLRITATHRPTRPGYCCSTQVRVTLADAAGGGHSSEIAVLDDNFDVAYNVVRAAEDSVVLLKADPDYGFVRGGVKLFFDGPSRRLLRRVDFEPGADLEFAGDAEARSVLGVTASGLMALRAGGVLPGGRGPVARTGQAKERVERHGPPTSTYAQFARARPGRVKDGYDEQSTMIEENIGAVQAEDDGIWFGKTFYDGEGQTGVGDIGYLDAQNRLTMLHLAEAAGWSIDTLLVEKQTIWAGLTRHTEGAEISGGLLEYDRRSKRAQIHRISDPIGAIVRADDAVFVKTSHGVYAVRLGGLDRFRAEPTLAGGVMVLADRP